MKQILKAYIISKEKQFLNEK